MKVGPARRIALLTTGRHDWGYLEPVARAIDAHNELECIVLATGTHLLAAAGRTVDAIARSGLELREIPLFVSDDASSVPAIEPEDLAFFSHRLTAALRQTEPQIVLILGDRIETLAAAVMAVASRKVLAHIHGGDRAPGEFDDANRHAITKLSHVHFPATRASANRILRMGEEPWRVHAVGSPGIDSILAGGLADPAEARAAVGLSAEEPFALVLMHPCGLGEQSERSTIVEVMEGVLEAGVTGVCLGPNADAGREVIWKAMRDFSSPRNWPIRATVDRRVFLSLMRDAVALVGNSSSGMIESAAVDAVAVDVGPRQQGREHSANVVHVEADRHEVAGILQRLREDQAYAAGLRQAECVFGDGASAERIAAVLAGLEVSNSQRTKRIEY